MCHSPKVDSKGRLKIPANFIASARGTGGEFYVTSENGGSVRIYPMRVWENVEEQLELLSLRNMNSQRLLARVKYFGQCVKVDRQGRLLIPIVLRGSAQMKGVVDVLQYANYLEVWNHARILARLNTCSTPTRREITLNGLTTVPQSPKAGVRGNKSANFQERERRFVVHRRISGDSGSHPGQAMRGARNGRTESARVA